MTDWIYFGTLPSIEDTTRYTAPRIVIEESWEFWSEPEDDPDWIDKNFTDGADTNIPETSTPQ